MKRSPWMLSLRIRGRVSPVFARSRVHAQVFAKRAPKGGEQEDVRIVKAQGDLDGAGVRLLEQLPQHRLSSSSSAALHVSSVLAPPTNGQPLLLLPSSKKNGPWPSPSATAALASRSSVALPGVLHMSGRADSFHDRLHQRHRSSGNFQRYHYHSVPH